MSRSCLPEKIQEKILLRLPVKSILRFKSVCKNWYALLSSRKFIKDYLNLSATKNNLRIRKFMIRVSDEEANDIFYSIDYASVLSPTSCKCDGAVLMDHPNDNNANDSIYWIIGSCNGLILLREELRETLYLWNPSTREYRKIIGAPKGMDNLAYGFGYDAKTDNYKIVCIATRQSDDDGEVDDFSEVYLYKAGSWSRSQNIPYRYSDDADGVLLNGALHWLGEETIIFFDINSEKFMDLPLPEEIMTCPVEIFNVQVLGDSLCLICGVRNARVDVWVMQNYGVRKSWTKQFTMTQKGITADPGSLKIYGSVKDSVILIQVGENLGIYNRKNDKIRILDINGIDAGVFSSESYVESLVSVDSGNYMGIMGKKQFKVASEIQDPHHLKKNRELTMEAAPDKEIKRKHNELTETSSSSKRKRTSDDIQELDAVNSSFGGVDNGFLIDVSAAVFEGVDVILSDVHAAKHQANASPFGGEFFKAY